MSEDILQMKGISKIYSNGIIANNKVDFSIKAGEIHALMGENGAGKSTLMKVLFGMESPEEGSISLHDNNVKIASPADAITLGIGMVHQHFMLVPSLTVAENMVLGAEPKKNFFIDMEKAVAMTKEVSEKYNLPVDPYAVVADLPVGIKQRIEFLKALLRGAKILILDEPTAVLAPQETVELFKQLVLLKKAGHTIIFISHKLKEIKEICDRITIMRNGKNVGVYNVASVTQEDISRLMVGRDVVLKVDKQPAQPHDIVLKVRNLAYHQGNVKPLLNQINFDIRKGEIVGIAGVEGNGQLELVEIITGLRPLEEGDVTISGQSIKNLSIREIRELGTAHIPQDRMTYGVAADANIEENIISDRFYKKAFQIGPLLNMKLIQKLSKALVNEYKVKCDSPYQTVGMLSGGNIQKVVVAREVSSNPEFLIADQPSRGIDIGSTKFIHRKLVELRDQGSAILLISADLNEVMELSDSLLVFYGGEITAYFPDTSKITEEELGYYMLGLRKQDTQYLRRCIHEH